MAKIVGYFDSGWERAINKAVNSLDKLRSESNKISEKDKNQNFSTIFLRRFQTRRRGINPAPVPMYGVLEALTGTRRKSRVPKNCAPSKRKRRRNRKIPQSQICKSRCRYGDEFPKIQEGQRQKIPDIQRQLSRKNRRRRPYGGRYDVSEKQLNECQTPVETTF